MANINSNYMDISYEIEKIQSSIRELQNLIKRSYNGKFTDGNQIICEAAVAKADVAYENLEQIKAVCDVLSDVFEEKYEI